MTSYIRIISIVILENREGKIYLQLRDNFPHIRNPNQWGIFGGGVEPKENKLAAARREIKEELLIDCDPQRIRFLISFEIDGRLFHLFHYLLEDEMTHAELQEGQRMGCFTKEQVLTGAIEGRPVVPHHLDMLRWFWELRN